MKTRPVKKNDVQNFIRKAEEFRNAMNKSCEAGDWDAAIANAVHCAISATDGFCGYAKGLRNAGPNHNDSVALFISIDQNNEEIKTAVSHLTRLLDMKTPAEYGERLAKQKEADEAVKHAERFLSFVKSKIK